MSNADYAGFYINLDRNPERRTEIEAEVSRYGSGDIYNRFRASDGNSLGFSNPHLKEGEMGCFTSHYLLLKQNLSSAKHLHIIEDDILFSSSTGPAIRWAIAQGFLAQYDIIFTDVFIPLLNDAYKAYKKFYDAAVTRDGDGKITRVAFSVVDVRDFIFASACSLLINRNSIGKLHGLYEKALMHDPAQPVDILIREKTREGIIRAGCLFPFVTSVRLDRILATNMAQRQDIPSALAASIARYSFFIGADWNECRRYMAEYLPVPGGDAHAAILNHLLAFSLTDAYHAP